MWLLTGIDPVIDLIARLDDLPKSASAEDLELLPVLLPPTGMSRGGRCHSEVVDLGRPDSESADDRGLWS